MNISPPLMIMEMLTNLCGTILNVDVKTKYRHINLNTAVIHPDEKAKVLKDQFESVLTADLQNLPTKESSPYSSMLEITITTPGALKRLSVI